MFMAGKFRADDFPEENHAHAVSAVGVGDAVHVT